MSTSKFETDVGTPKSTATTPVSNTKIASVPSKVPPRSCFQTIVTVEVGPERKAFLIHKDLLIFYSDYFRGAFGGSFSEASTGKITLADERVDVFNTVNQFVYTRQLSDELDSGLSWNMLYSTWLFGDKYLMPALQNKAMSALIEKNMKVKVISTEQLKFIYDKTLPFSPLRKVLVDLVAYKSDMEHSITLDEVRNWPHEALLDLIKVLGAKKKEHVGKFELPEANMGKCYYHIHAEGEDCDTKL